jgi:photosystem I reaction center subunit XII
VLGKSVEEGRYDLEKVPLGLGFYLVLFLILKNTLPSNFLLKDFFMISESQIFIALFVALFNGVLALRLGSKLYQS